MADRERLIELLGDYLYSEQIADHLLANGVIVPPCKVGDPVWFLLEDDFPEHRWFLSKERVTDVSKKGFFVNSFTPSEDDHEGFAPWADVGKEAFFSKKEANKALVEITNGREIQPDDTVLHKPSGERWIVCGVDYEKDELIPCGWPFPTLAKLSDCELLERGGAQSEGMIRALRDHGLDRFIRGEEDAV